MRAMLLIFTLTVVHLFSSAQQQQRYIYIQTEPQHPFYAKINEEVHSSNASGFLIIPKLRDTIYTIVAGFPQNLFPEYRFRLNGIRQDKGFTLKNFDDKGWGLIDNGSGEILMGEKTGTGGPPKEVIPPARTNDAFTVILAAVINDPGLPGTELISQNASYALVLPPKENKKDAKPEQATAKTEIPRVTNEELTIQQEAVAQTQSPAIKKDQPLTQNETLLKPDSSKIKSDQTRVQQDTIAKTENAAAKNEQKTIPAEPLAKPDSAKSGIDPKTTTQKSAEVVPEKPKESKPDDSDKTVVAAAPANKTTTSSPQTNKAKKANTELITGPAPIIVPATEGKDRKTEPQNILKPTTIKKFFDNRGAKSHIQIYADVYGTSSDTIRVEIPVEELKPVVTKQESIPEKEPEPKKVIPVVEDKKTVKEKNVVEEKPKNITKEPVATTSVKKETADTSATAGTLKTTTREDCRRMAEDRDVQAVRRRIIAIREIDDMVNSALRDFKLKCFTADQVKSISVVFTTEEGKYKLMDAAYPYVYDPLNYKSLESLLHDPYYINRFRSLLK